MISLQLEVKTVFLFRLLLDWTLDLSMSTSSASALAELSPLKWEIWSITPTSFSSRQPVSPHSQIDWEIPSFQTHRWLRCLDFALPGFSSSKDGTDEFCSHHGEAKRLYSVKNSGGLPLEDILKSYLSSDDKRYQMNCSGEFC